MLCFIWGIDWIFKYYLDEPQLKVFETLWNGLVDTQKLFLYNRIFAEIMIGNTPELSPQT